MTETYTTNPLPKIPPVQLINLASRSDRLIHCLGQLGKVGLSSQVTRLEASTPEMARQEYISYIDQVAYDNIEGNLKSTVVMPTWGAVACAISHLRCWANIVQHDYPYALVVEDDLQISDKRAFQFSFEQAIRLLNREIQRSQSENRSAKPLFLTFGSKVLSTRGQVGSGSDGIPGRMDQLVNRFTGLGCYLINYTACEYLYQNLLPLRYQLDCQLGNFFRQARNVGPTSAGGGRGSIRAFNLASSGVIQKSSLGSNVQYHFLKTGELMASLRHLPVSILRSIYQYLPQRWNLKPITYLRDPSEWQQLLVDYVHDEYHNYPEGVNIYQDDTNIYRDDVYY